MTIRRTQKIAVTVLVVLALAALGATVATWSWGNPGERLRARGAGGRNGARVDSRPLDAAEQLAQLAETRTERGYAAEAVRLADYSVDLAFAAAIRNAANTPPLSTEATRAITARQKSAAAAMAADSSRIAALSRQAGRGAPGDLQQQLDLARAQLEVDADDAEDARQDMIRAGGDRLASIQRLRSQHDTSLHTASPAAGGSAGTSPQPVSIEMTRSSNVADQVAAWRSLNAKATLLDQARQRARDRERVLAQAHDTLEQQVAAERSSQRILHTKGRNAGEVALARVADTGGGTARRPDTAPGAGADSGSPTALSFLRDLSSDQRDLSEFDRRIQNEQDLATVYGNWIDYVQLRKDRFLHGIFLSIFWILVIALLVWGANEGVQHLFSEAALQRGRLHTVRTVILFGVQAIGVVLIVLVAVGKPNNFATVLALAGAGLALALQDFILGFFGWFALMGKDGIRPGDWVEINGVGGEVLEVGVFQTVLLETSNWSDSAHPTGRKVSFVNSFAIQGHYFNFSTTGQWLWDELDVHLTEGSDPYAVAEEIQRIAARETNATADIAEQDWQRAVPARVRQAFSSVPSVTVRPSGGGVSVVVRYLTRASERPEIRARIYRAIIELLHGKQKA